MKGMNSNMAKKSSVSKGYRKQHVKKPFLTKKEIILLCLIVAALIVGAVLLFTYDDGALKLVDGKPAIDGENWLIVDGSNVRGRARYFKLAEVSDLEGFTLTSEPSLLDANVPSLTLTPDAGDAEIDSIGYSTFHNHADALVDNYVALMKSNEEYTVSEAQSGEADGLSYRYCTYTRAYHEDAEETAEAAEDAAETATEAVEDTAETAAEAVEDAAEAATEAAADAAETAAEAVTDAAETATEAVEDAAETATEAVENAAEAATEAVEDAAETEAAAPNRFAQAANAYIDGAHDSSVIISVVNEADSEDGLLSEEALLEYLRQAVSAVKLEAGK